MIHIRDLLLAILCLVLGYKTLQIGMVHDHYLFTIIGCIAFVIGFILFTLWLVSYWQRNQE